MVQWFGWIDEGGVFNQRLFPERVREIEISVLQNHLKDNYNLENEKHQQYLQLWNVKVRIIKKKPERALLSLISKELILRVISCFNLQRYILSNITCLLSKIKEVWYWDLNYILDNRFWNMLYIVKIDLNRQLRKVSSRHGISVINMLFPWEWEKQGKTPLFLFPSWCPEVGKIVG